MKINWGTGIVIGMVAFISFILYLVITMSTNNDFSHDLVTEDYYAKEIVYQNEIDAESNSHNLSESINGKRTTEGWLLTFPNEINSDNSKGIVFLYRPSNKVLDFEMPLEITNQTLLIPNKKMIDGRWNVTVDWTYNGKHYLYKKEIVY
jgi:nitrogen fixation protein FixH